MNPNPWLRPRPVTLPTPLVVPTGSSEEHTSAHTSPSCQPYYLRKVSDALIVSQHQEDLFPLGAGQVVRRRRYGAVDRLRTVVARQVDLDERALAGFGIDFHRTARLLDEPEHLAEAEAGALAHALGGEEG